MLNLSNPSRKRRLVILAVLLAGNGRVSAVEQPRVEVFTTSGLPIAADLNRNGVEIYEIDGIQRFEELLSQGLPFDADAARHAATKRLGQVEQGQIMRVQRAAMGLSKAMQYGINRYPAVVLDGVAVVYGVTDLTIAHHRYRQWQEASGP